MFAYCGNNPITRFDPYGTYHTMPGVEDENDFLNTLQEYIGAGAGTCSYANAYNAIDAGYTYEIDYSQALNSSLFGGGLYTQGYSIYQTTTSPINQIPQDASKHFSPDQQAVLTIANEYKEGISRVEAEILVGWAEEYGISSHGPAVHFNRKGVWGHTLHIKIKNHHIKIYD